MNGQPLVLRGNMRRTWEDASTVGIGSAGDPYRRDGGDAVGRDALRGSGGRKASVSWWWGATRTTRGRRAAAVHRKRDRQNTIDRGGVGVATAALSAADAFFGRRPSTLFSWGHKNYQKFIFFRKMLNFRYRYRDFHSI